MALADFVPLVQTTTVTLLSGQTVSPAVDLFGCSLCGLIFPAAFTGATVTFQVSPDNVTYYALNDSANAAISLTVTVSKAYSFSNTVFRGFRFIKIVSASSEGADRIITIQALPSKF